MAPRKLGWLKAIFTYSYGLYCMITYGLLAITLGYFFKKPTEKEALELQLLRNQFWDLSKKWSEYSHQIYTLKNGFKFHYVCNDAHGSAIGEKPLVILIHGFPDSWAIWRHVLRAESLQQASVVAVDLPGYGGSASLDEYSATTVLESLTEFIIAMRTKYGIDGAAGVRHQRTIIVGHDWGCLISMRLATDAPQLADRFILTNGPLMPLAISNTRRLISSSSKMLKIFLRSPIRSRTLLFNAVRTLKPIFRQLSCSSYIFVFQLPPTFVEYFGAGGNSAFLRLCHKSSHGTGEFTPLNAAECMASTVGPSMHEVDTRTADGEGYSESVMGKRAVSNFFNMCKYYRDGTAVSRWNKSIETIAILYSIAPEVGAHRASSGAGIFDDGPEGALNAPTTVLWGRKDSALTTQLCLDGIRDYLTQGSQVVDLPRSGHFTPVEQESRIALSRTIEWALKGEREDIGAVIEACYPQATVIIQK